MRKNFLQTLTILVGMTIPFAAKAETEDYSSLDESIYKTGVTQAGDAYVIVKDYSKFEYTYGKGKTATLAEKAKGTEQIMEFIKAVTTNKGIPGPLKDPTSADKMPANGRLYFELTTGSDGNPTYNKKVSKESAATDVLTPYYYNKAGDYDIPWGDYTPDYNGMTAILVKMKSDCQADETVLSNSTIKIIDTYIESVRMMENCLRVEGENPGWIFSTKTNLNKFYIMTKGKFRGNHDRPFFWMFEQLSPADDVSPLPVNTYEAMLDGTKYYINHDCRSVPAKYHPTNMGEDQVDEEFNVSVLVFIPDNRFAALQADADNSYKSKANEKRNILVGNDWTRDYETSFIYYNDDYAPYFLFNNVTLGTDKVEKIKNEDATDSGYCKVLLTWVSEISKILATSGEYEKFRLYRVVDGVKELVDVSELIAYDDDTELRAEDNTIRHLNGEMKVYVKEEMAKHGRQVEYVVEASVAGAGIDYVESNPTYASIPGHDTLERCELVLAKNPSSQFIHNDESLEDTDHNHYIHLLTLSNDPEYDHPIRRQHLLSEDTSEQVVFTLMRTDSITNEEEDEAEWEEVQTLTITNIKEVDGNYIYYGVLRDADGTQLSEEQAYLSTVVADGDTGIATILKNGDEKLVWFSVEFDAYTKDNLHPDKYYYQLQSNIEVYDDNGNKLGNAESRVIRIDIPHSYNLFELSSFPQSEIDADTYLTHEVSEKQIYYYVKNNASVRKYELQIYGEPAKYESLTHVRRAQDGTYSLSSRVAELENTGLYSYNYVTDETPLTTDTKDLYFTLTRGMDYEPIRDYLHTVVLIKDYDDNTYGTGRSYILPPRIDGEIYDLHKATTDSYQFGIGFTRASECAKITNDQYYRVKAVSDFNPYVVNVFKDDFWSSRDNFTGDNSLHAYSNAKTSTADERDWDEELQFTVTPDWTVGEFNQAEWETPGRTLENLQAITREEGKEYPLVVSVKVRNYALHSDATEDDKQYVIIDEVLSVGLSGDEVVTGVDNAELSVTVPVTIYSVNGTILRRYTADRYAPLDLSNLPAGVYIVKVDTKTVKVIK